MPTVIKRCISLLLILMLVVSLIPSVYAAETADEADPAASTETTEEITNTEPEENMIPPLDETEPPVTALNHRKLISLMILSRLSCF